MNLPPFVNQFLEAEFNNRRPTTSNVAWTMHLSRSAAAAAHALRWAIATKAHKDRAPGENWKRAEYLALDAMCWDPTASEHECPLTKRRYGYPRPLAVTEFENNPKKALYDYWKLLCVHSNLRLLTLIAAEAIRESLVRALSGLRADHSGVDGADVILFGPIDMANGSERWAPYTWGDDGRFVQAIYPPTAENAPGRARGAAGGAAIPARPRR